MRVSDEQLAAMVQQIKNGVKHDISWPTKQELALSLDKARKSIKKLNTRKLMDAELVKRLASESSHQ